MTKIPHGCPLPIRNFQFTYFSLHSSSTWKLSEDVEGTTETKHKLLERFKGFLALLGGDMQPAGKQYVQFLLDELCSENPRVFVLEPVIRSFREAFVGTSHASEARELANKVWSYLDALK